MRVAAYCRVSTEKEEQTQSLSKQKEYFTELCKSKNYELIKLYADEGISGKQIRNRTQFRQMIQDASKDKFDLVMVKDVSRFARNTEDFIHNVRKIKSYGVNVFFVTHNLDIQEGSEFYLTMLAAMAQEESAKLSERVKFGKNITAKKGRVPNFVFGYDKGEDAYTLQINPKEEEIVRKMFDMFVNHGMGTGKIAAWLNQNKVLTKKKKVANWYSTTVNQILRNQIYIGKVINKKTEVVDFITGRRREIPEEDQLVANRPEFRIISDETFYKAQDILKSRRKAFNLDNKRESYKYPFSTLIKCSECGYSFKRTQRQYKKGGKIYVKWFFSQINAKGVGSCINEKVIKDEEITEATKEYLNGILENKRTLVGEVTKKVKQMINEQNNNTTTTKLDIERKLDALANKKQKYMDMFTNEVITMAELKEYTKGMNEEKDKLEIELNLMQNSDVVITDIGKHINNHFATIERIIKEDNLNNELLKQILEYECYPDGNIKMNLKITSEHDLNITVPLSNILTQGCMLKELFVSIG